MTSEIPMAVHRAIDCGAVVVLASRNGWLAVTEGTTCPGCREYRMLFVLIQKISATSSRWLVGCIECAGKYEDLATGC